MHWNVLYCHGNIYEEARQPYKRECCHLWRSRFNWFPFSLWRFHWIIDCWFLFVCSYSRLFCTLRLYCTLSFYYSRILFSSIRLARLFVNVSVFSQFQSSAPIYTYFSGIFSISSELIWLNLKLLSFQVKFCRVPRVPRCATYSWIKEIILLTNSQHDPFETKGWKVNPCSDTVFSVEKAL